MLGLQYKLSGVTFRIFLPRPLVWANIPNMYVTMKLRFVETHFTSNTDYVWEISLRYLPVHNAATSILKVWEDSGLSLGVPGSTLGSLWKYPRGHFGSILGSI